MKSSFGVNAALLFVAALGSATVSLAAPDHFILTRLASLAFARIDPIINPGNLSGHVHNIMGASCFNQKVNTPEQQQACDCSSAIVGDDKSNYWAPALYYRNQNNTFSPILNGNRIYYFTKGPDIKPFPPGLRMISGMAMTRNLSDTRTMGIRISCNHGLQTPYLPNGTSHPGGCDTIAMGIFFPSCGLASGDLDSPDHFSHMTWPQRQLGGGTAPFDDPNGYECPDSHPIKYPTIFMEASYYLTPEQPWYNGNPLILSNGDQSGLTYHADFLDGWNQQTLKDALAQCGDGKGVGENLGKCAPLAKSSNESATWGCRYQGKIPNEDVGFYRPIKELPGCNKVWPAAGPDTKPECKEDNPPDMIYPNTQFVNLRFRERVPMVFPLVENTTNLDEMLQYIPGLGETGVSQIRQWGFDASNKDSLELSTAAEIMKAAGDPLEGFVESVHSPSVSASAASAPVSAIAGANVHLVEADLNSSSSSAVSAARSSSVAAASSPTPDLGASPEAPSQAKVCKKKKREIVEQAHDVSFNVKEHLQRRSRHSLIRH